MTNIRCRNRLIHGGLLFLVLSLSAFAQAARAATIVGSNFLNDSLLSIDSGTGAGSAVGPFGGNFGFVTGLAYDRNTNTLYGVDSISIQNGGQLIKINAATGTATAVGALGLTNMNGLAFDPNTNTLYGSRSSSSRLVTINTTTGVATDVGLIGFNNVLGLGFDPNTNTLYGVEAVGSRRLLTINTTTGAGAAVGATGISGDFIQLGGLDFDSDNNILYGVVDDLDVFANNRLVAIDTATGLATPLPSQLGFEGTQGLAVIVVPEPPAISLLCTALLGLLGSHRAATHKRK